MPERWDCIYVDRIKPSGRIYLTRPEEYGPMRRGQKVTKTICKVCGQLKGSSNETKILIATAMATSFNRTRLKRSNGLIVRGFKGRIPYKGLPTALIKTRGKSLRIKASTGWIVYISPEEKFYSVINGRHKGDELTGQQSKMIRSCIQDISNAQR